MTGLDFGWSFSREETRTRAVRASIASWTVVTSLALAACSGGGELRGSVYRDQEARYRVGTLDARWERLHLAGADANDLAWRDRQSDAVIQVNSTCDPASDVPLSALTNHLLIGFTERAIADEALVSLDGREALRTHLTARLDGVPRELVLVVLKKDECVYDLALIARPGAEFTSASASFEPFVQSFSTSVGARDAR